MVCHRLDVLLFPTQLCQNSQINRNWPHLFFIFAGRGAAPFMLVSSHQINEEITYCQYIYF